jgi:putative MATE family efflux protein
MLDPPNLTMILLFTGGRLPWIAGKRGFRAAAWPRYTVPRPMSDKPTPGPTASAGIFDQPILPLLIRLSAPIFAGMAVQFVYNLTDTLFISLIDRSDPSYVGGTGIIFPLVFFAIAVSNGIQVGVSSLVARAIGERNTKVLSTTVESGLVIGLTVSFVLLAVGYGLHGGLLRLLGAQGDYYTHAREYLLWIMPSIGLAMLSSVFVGILQGEGKMQHAMVAMFIGTAVNIALDPILIFGAGWGVAGAALATDISQALAVAYIVSVFVRGKSTVAVDWRRSNIDTHTMGKIIAVGLPQAVTQIIMSMSFLVFNRIVVGLDPLALTAFTLNGRIEQVILLPIFAMGSAMITMAGQNAGRGLYDRVRDVWRQGIAASAAVVGAIAGAVFLLAPVIYPVFTDNTTVLGYSVTQTRIMAFSFLFAVLGIQARSIFLAIARPFPALVLTLLRLLGLALPAILILVYVLHLGMWGVWIGLVGANVISGLISLLWTNRTIAGIRSGRIRLART